MRSLRGFPILTVRLEKDPPMLRLALLAALLLAPALGAQIVLSGTSYSQNFNMNSC